MHIQLDPLGGIAGDMFIAAVLDAWPELTDDTLACIRSAGIAPEWRISVADHNDQTFRGTQFLIHEPANFESAHHHHYKDIANLLRNSSIESRVRNRALAIFKLLAEAEAEVHGVPVDDVSFHEVGAWDSVGDIVGAAFLIEKLSPTSWTLGPVPLGAGRINTAHGPMPVPAPATTRLLTGFSVVDDGIGGERVTPTGAAILRHLSDSLGMPVQGRSEAMTLCRTGTGFGTRTLPGISNICRIIAFERDTCALRSGQVGVIHFEIDDQSAEDLAIGIDALRAMDGVLDVLQIPAVGKKGRMVSQLQVLCQPNVLNSVIDTCFAQTTTLGLRWSVVARTSLERKLITDDSGDDPVSVKVASRPDGKLSAKAEAESIRRRGDHSDRESARREAEDNILQKIKLDGL